MKQGVEYLLGDTKRRLDIVGGLAVGMAILPASLAIGATTMVDTRSVHPLFVQDRVGKHGRNFAALKFRTIPLSRMSEATHGTFDHRASRWGQALRQTGLDEIPQICNVILGSMSLVGARPMIEQDIDFMEFAAPRLFDEWYAFYRSARPGLAGPSQVYRHHFREGRNKEIYHKSAELDLDYFNRASFTTDLDILARTPLGMIKANISVVENQDEPLTAPTSPPSPELES